MSTPNSPGEAAYAEYRRGRPFSEPWQRLCEDEAKHWERIGCAARSFEGAPVVEHGDAELPARLRAVAHEMTVDEFNGRTGGTIPTSP